MRNIISQTTKNAADLITDTYGPHGGNIITVHNGVLDLTKDGATVLNALPLTEDPLQNAVIRLLKDGSRELSKFTGDGTSTYALLVDALVQEAYDYEHKNWASYILKMIPPEFRHDLSKLQSQCEKITDKAFLSVVTDNIQSLITDLINILLTSYHTLEGHKRAATFINACTSIDLEFVPEDPHYELTISPRNFFSKFKDRVAEEDSQLTFFLEIPEGAPIEVQIYLDHIKEEQLTMVQVFKEYFLTHGGDLDDEERWAFKTDYSSLVSQGMKKIPFDDYNRDLRTTNYILDKGLYRSKFNFKNYLKRGIHAADLITLKYESTGGNLRLMDDLDPNLVEKSFEFLAEACQKRLRSLSRKNLTGSIIKSIAETSSKDKELSKLIADLYIKHGKDLSIMVERHEYSDIRVIEHDGFLIDRGYAHKAFLTDTINEVIELENPVAAVCPYGLNDPNVLYPILVKVQESGANSLFIVANDFSPECIALLNQALNKGINILPVKVEGISYEDKQSNGRDILSYVLNTSDIKDSRDFCTLENHNMFKFSGKITSTEFHTKLEAKEFDSSGIIKSLESQLKVAPKSQLPELRKRIARFSSSLVTLKIGGSDNMEIKERLHRVDDIIGAIRTAYKGVIPGGGVAFYILDCFLHHVEVDSPTEFTSSPEFNFAVNVLRSAVIRLHKRLYELCRMGDVYWELRDEFLFHTYNRPKMTWKDLMGVNFKNPRKLEIGIPFTDPRKNYAIDPVEVVCCSINSAVKTASQLLLTKNFVRK